jgi:hypothetical protein
MSPLKIKCCGLTDADELSLQSMLRLSTNLLTHTWEITNATTADLYIYSFDTETGKTAWEKHQDGKSALLTNSGNITETLDLIFKKPLRKSSFAESLNLIEEKILSERAQNDETTLDESSSEQTSSSWTKKLFSSFKLKKNPNAYRPELVFYPLEDTITESDSIQDAALLKTWISQLPSDATQRTTMLLKNLQPLNAAQLKPNQRLTLLEIYYPCVVQLLFERDASTAKRDLDPSRENLKAIESMRHLLKAMAQGYQQLLKYYYERGESPNKQEMMPFSLNRASEIIAYQILHAFQYYRSAPNQCWQTLHAYYLYSEDANTLSEPVTLKSGSTVSSFLDIYAQILLTGIGDPYGLARYDVFRLFQMMRQFAGKIHIYTPSEKQINSTSNFMLTGYFAIDCQSDLLPDWLVNMPIKLRQKNTMRVLDLQSLLHHLDHYFKQPETLKRESYDADLKVLHKCLPHLNTTHERRYQRFKSGKNRHVTLSYTVDDIYQQLTNSDESHPLWQMCNQSSQGMMLKSMSDDAPTLSIKDLIGICEPSSTSKLAKIRWLHITPEGDTYIGVELIEGEPVPVTCMPDGEAKEYTALIIPSEKLDDPHTLITHKGLHSPHRQVRIKHNEDEPYLITAGDMLSYTLDYEIFNYKLTRIKTK